MSIPDNNNLLSYFQEEYNSLHSSFDNFDNLIDSIFQSIKDIKDSTENFKQEIIEIRSLIASSNNSTLSTVLDSLSRRMEDIIILLSSFSDKFNYIQKQSSDFSSHLSSYFRDFSDGI